MVHLCAGMHGAAGSAHVVAGPSCQESAADTAQVAQQAEAGSQSAESGSNGGIPQEAMDLQQALKIVSKHYVARNSSRPLRCPPVVAMLLRSCHIVHEMQCTASHPSILCATAQAWISLHCSSCSKAIRQQVAVYAVRHTKKDCMLQGCHL